MHVRALRGIVARAGWFLHDSYIETYRQRLRRETLRVVAGLVAQDAVHHVLSRHYGMQRVYRYGNGEISAVDVQLLVWRKRKGQILARRILNPPQDNVGGQIHFQIRRNQKFGLRRVGIDVKPGRYTEIQVDHGLLSALSSD